MVAYLLRYNNYYNRIVKAEQTIVGYQPYLVGNNSFGSNPLTGVQFKPGDNVNTQMIVNWDGDDPDYIVTLPDGSHRIFYLTQVLPTTDQDGKYDIANGVTVTINSDYSVFSGTASADGSFWWNKDTFQITTEGDYMMAGTGYYPGYQWLSMTLYRCGDNPTNVTTPGVTFTQMAYCRNDTNNSCIIAHLTPGAYAISLNYFEGYDYDNVIHTFSPMLFNLSKMFQSSPYGTAPAGTVKEMIMAYPEILVPTYIYGQDTTLSNLSEAQRWFVIESTRTREGQYLMQLRRDVIVDNLDLVLAAPTFIEKATIEDPNDPAIYNRENMTLNQIKTSEELLTDITGTSWIVGYLDPQVAEANDETVAIDIDSSYTPDITVSGINSWFWYTYVSSQGITYEENRVFSYAQKRTDLSANFDILNSYTNSSDVETYMNTFVGALTKAQTEELASYAGDGKLIYDSNDGTYYQAIVDYDQKYSYWEDPVNEASALYTSVSADSGYNGPAKLNYVAVKFTMKLSTVAYANSITLTIPHTKRVTNDAPYNVFAIPYGCLGSMSLDGLTSPVSFSCGKENAMQVAQRITKAYSGAGKLYDLQLLPYCPLADEFLDSDGEIDFPQSEYGKSYSVVNFGSHYQYNPITGTFVQTNQAVPVCWIEKSTFHRELNHSITITNTALDLKMSNETELYRLCSPNYNGVWEFSPAMNGGVLNFFADCTYKPISPYIHVSPNFSKLYGQNFGDARGLICGGDFSLPIVNDNWLTFEANNKNYQNIFDRNIEHTELINRVAKTQDILNAVAGGVAGVGLGAVAGSGAGAGGAVAGAMFGGIGSAITGYMDVKLKENLRNEALDLTRDQFGYQLGNIAARANGLAKVSAYNANNKIIPFLEKYTCTDVERQALQDKLTYNGWTVMRIGTVGDYQRSTRTYIKGKLIRIGDINDDFHMATAIADELNKGVYI